MATSGTLTWGPITTGSYNGAKFVFNWNVIDTTETTTTISWTVTGEGRSTSPTWIASSFFLYLDGEEKAYKPSYSGSSAGDSFNNSEKASGIYTITHDKDGSGSFVATLSAWITTATPNYTDVSQTFILDDLNPQEDPTTRTLKIYYNGEWHPAKVNIFTNSWKESRMRVYKKPLNS